MADSAPKSNSQSDTFGLRHLSSSFFNIPGFFIGFSSRGSFDSDSVRSPKSPLDFSFFSNLSNPFGNRSPRLPCHSGHQNKWDCSKAGLGMVNLLADETKWMCEVLDSPKRKNIVFAPQVKNHAPVKSNSLPRNYTILQSQPKSSTPSPRLGKSDAAFGWEEVLLGPKPCESSSLTSLTTTKAHWSSSNFYSEERTATSTTLPLVNGEGSQKENFLIIKPSSLPLPIGSGQGYVGSLSGHEIQLSEDYTCIISHGPNPKTTHVYGDYILECHSNELSNFDKVEIPGIESHQEAKRPEDSTLHPSSEFLSFCCSCKKKLEKEDDIYMYRGEKAFCSFDCSSEVIFAEEELETLQGCQSSIPFAHISEQKTCDESTKRSPNSSYHEDLFLMGVGIPE